MIYYSADLIQQTGRVHGVPEERLGGLTANVFIRLLDKDALRFRLPPKNFCRLSQSEKSIKIPLTKLVSVIPRSNGIILQKDGASAKPLTLMPDDPWFIYNLIANLNLIQ